MDNKRQFSQREQSFDEPSSSSHPHLLHSRPETGLSSLRDQGDDDDIEASGNNSEVHLAAKKGDAEGLKTLQSNGHPLMTNYKDRTPLHYACEFSVEDKAVEMADIILDGEWERSEKLDSKCELIDYQDFEGDTALHLAARMGHAKLATKLMFLSANVNLRNHKGEEPIQLIIVNVPSALINVLNAALKFAPSDESNDENRIVRMDIAPIVGSPNGKNGNLFVETGMFTYWLWRILCHPPIILHPAVQLFILLKRRRVRVLSWTSTLFNIVWLLLLIHFTWDVYRVQCPYQPETLNPEMCDLNSGSLLFLRLEAWTILVMLILHLPKEFHDTCCSGFGMKYFAMNLLQLKNISKWVLMTLTVIVIIPGITTNDEPDTIAITPLVYQSTYFAFMLSWVLIAEQVVNIFGFAVPKFASLYLLLGARFNLIFTVVIFTFIQLVKPERTDSLTLELTSDFSIKIGSTEYVYFVIIVFLVVVNLQIMMPGGMEVFFGRSVPSFLLACQLEEMYLMEKLILSKNVQAFLGHFGKKHYWLLRFLIAQQNDTDLRMAVDVKLSEIPKQLRKQVELLAEGNSGQVEVV